MLAELHNRTPHPDAQVRPLVALAVQTAAPPAPVHVHLYPGRAENGQPCGWAFQWDDGALWIKVGLPDAGQFPMTVAPRLDLPGFPRFTFLDWREALVATCAHEAHHLHHIHASVPYDEQPEELAAELAAARALTALHAHPDTVPS